MSSPIVVPFNFRPVSIQRGTANYTCPAGKYAKVTINTSGAAFGSRSGVFFISPDSTHHRVIDSFNKTVQIWVNSGDVISNALSNANSSVSSNNTSSIRMATGETTSTINYNGNPIAIFRARGGDIAGGRSTEGFIEANVSGNSSYHFYAEEYNQIS
jgi:hypothetical protein